MEKQIDVRKKDYIAISSIPASVGGTLGASVTLDPGETATFQVNVIPDDIRMSLWNEFFSIFVDVNDSPHIFPEGSSLDGNQRTLNIQAWPDWGASSDVNNIRTYKIRLWNQDWNPHTYYLRFKAYTFATVPGSA